MPRLAGPAEAAIVRAVADPRIAPDRGGDLPPRALTDREIRAALDPFVGRECDPGSAAGALEDRYRFLGYVPSATVSCEDGMLRAFVLESRLRVSLITFEPDDLSRTARSTRVRGEAPAPLVTRGAPRSSGLLRTAPATLQHRAPSLTAKRCAGYTVAHRGRPNPRPTRRAPISS
jgi:hypothetical protein